MTLIILMSYKYAISEYVNKVIDNIPQLCNINLFMRQNNMKQHLFLYYDNYNRETFLKYYGEVAIL